MEDDLDMLNLYRGVLRDVFEIIPATNGKGAMELAVAEVPDLILMDIMMPEMDGLQAARLIRQNPKTYSIPIIAVTAGALLKAEHGEMATNRANAAMCPELCGIT